MSKLDSSMAPIATDAMGLGDHGDTRREPARHVVTRELDRIVDGHAAGAYVATTCRATNKDYAVSLGADTAIAYDGEDFGTLRDIDVVFDLLGGAVHDRSYPVLRSGGRLIYLNALPIVDRGAEFGVTVRLGYKGPADDPDMIARVIDTMASGAFLPQVSSTMPLSEAAEAHRLIQSGQVTRGRLVLTV